MPIGAILGGIGSLASAFSSNKAAKAQAAALEQQMQMLRDAQIQNFSFGNRNGDNPFGSYNPGTGRFETGLGSRLQGQRDMTDQFASLFGSQVGQDFTGGLGNTIGQAQNVFGMQPGSGAALLAGLQGGTQGAYNLAGAGMGRAAGLTDQLDPFGQQAFGLSSGFMNNIGTGEDARNQSLSLMRQLAAPEEARAFNNLQQNQFATGRLGSSGGALQTEAFARGLGQADLSRQLASFGEGRATQQNNLGLASGLAGLGGGAMTLGNNLLSNAFGNFQGISGLSQDIERQRFGQAGLQQQNMFDQLNSIFGMQSGQLGMQSQLQGDALSNFFSSLGAGQAIDQVPLDRLGFGADLERMRSNAGLAAGGQYPSQQAGIGDSSTAAIFSGLAGAAQNGGFDFLKNIFGKGGNSQPTGGLTMPGFNPYAGTVNSGGLSVPSSAFGSNPFAGLIGGN